MSVLYISVTVHRHVFCLLGFIHCQFSWFCSDMDSGPLFLSNSLSSLSDVRLPNVLCQLFPRSSVFSTLYQEFSLGLYPCLVLSCFLSCVYYLLCLLSFVFYISCTVSCVFCLLSVGLCLLFIVLSLLLSFAFCQLSCVPCLLSLSSVLSQMSCVFSFLSIVFSLLSFVFYLLPIVLSCVFCILSIFASFVLESLYFYRSRFDCISSLRN